MGFGAAPLTKRKLFCASRLYSSREDLSYDVATVDVAAMFRKLVPFNLGAEVTPLSAVQRIFLPSILRFKTSTVVFCFDSPRHIPEVRKIFHAERRYKASPRPPKAGQLRCPEDGRNYTPDTYPATDADIAALTMTSMPCPWAKFWNSAAGKVALWRCIEDSIRHLVVTGQVRRGVRCIIDGIDGHDLWVHPADDKAEFFKHHYGEGDMKSILWATHLPGRVLVMTIDWDVVLALLLYDAPLDVWIGTVYHGDKDGIESAPFMSQAVELTKKGALKVWGELNPAVEIVHPPFPEWTRLERQHYLMLCLAMGGVDYCYGLSAFGFPEAKLLELALDGTYGKFMVNMFDKESPLERCIKFYPEEFAASIKKAFTPGRVRHKPPPGRTIADEFSTEVRNILYCIMYFGGFDSARVPSGPPPPDPLEMLYPGATTMHDIFTMSFPPVFFDESYPATAATLPHPPSVSYCGAQLSHIKL